MIYFTHTSNHMMKMLLYPKMLDTFPVDLAGTGLHESNVAQRYPVILA